MFQRCARFGTADPLFTILSEVFIEMAKKSISQKRAERQRQDNQALQNVLNVFLVGLVAEIYLLLVYRNYIMGSVDSVLAWHSVLKASVFVGLAVLVLGVAGLIWKRKCPTCRKVLPYVALAGLFLTVSGAVISTFFDAGVTLMCILVPVVTVLGLIYYLFQRECFVTTVALAAAMFTVWVCSKTSGTVVVAGAAAVIVLLAVLAAGTFMAQKNGGSVKGLRIFSAECSYPILYASFAIAVVAIVAALAMSSVTYYLMWGLGVLLFVEMVFYTTKLM